MSNNIQKPVVSVVSLAFNQEKYIRKTLEGFFMQKTTFPVEFIVHDDASTDKTADIIQEFAEKDPERFVAVIEEENQFSKGEGFILDLMKSAKGKYLCFCEGDDYWTDPLKLQKQYDAMEAHPECGFCAHKTTGLSEDEKKVIQIFPRVETSTGVMEVDEVARRLIRDSEWLFHTSSYFLVRDKLIEGYDRKYEFLIKPMYSDWATILMGCLSGKFYYINESMSVYRMNVKTGMMYSARRLDQRKQSNLRGISSIRSFDEITNGIYHSYVENFIRFMKFQIAETDKNYKYLIRKEMKEYWMTIPVYKRIAIRCFIIAPFTENIYYYLRKKVKDL